MSQFDNHLIAQARGPADVPRLRHVNVMRHPRVIGDDVKKLRALLQRADDLRPPTLEDADHRSGAGREGVGAQTFRADVPAHEHAVLVQRRARGTFRHGDFFEAGIIWLKKTLALAIHSDPARNEIRLARLDVAISFDARDLAF